MTRLIVFTIAFVIAGAANAQESEDTCGATGLQGLVGQTSAIAELLEFPDQTIRILGPDSVATTDYRPERLNIMIDGGVIDRIGCG
jgi:hypothetical protein